jgi:hypothetical protein
MSYIFFRDTQKLRNVGRTTTSIHYHLLGLSLLPLLSNKDKQLNPHSGIHSIPASNKLHLCSKKTALKKRLLPKRKQPQ